MMHSIKVSDEIYKELIKLQRPRETFSEEVERLLRVYSTLFEVSEALGPSHYLQERPKLEGTK